MVRERCMTMRRNATRAQELLNAAKGSELFKAGESLAKKWGWSGFGGDSTTSAASKKGNVTVSSQEEPRAPPLCGPEATAPEAKDANSTGGDDVVGAVPGLKVLSTRDSEVSVASSSSAAVAAAAALEAAIKANGGGVSSSASSSAFASTAAASNVASLPPSAAVASGSPRTNAPQAAPGHRPREEKGSVDFDVLMSVLETNGFSYDKGAFSHFWCKVSPR